MLAKTVNFIFSHTLRQNFNAIKYKLSKPSPRLSYRPPKLSLYITSRCNLACPMCGYHAKESTGEFRVSCYPDMSFDRFRHIMAFFPECYSLTITAEGEPFLNKDIFNMIDYATKDLNLLVDISTNGFSLSDEQIDKILASKLDTLNISLDGTSPEEFNQVRTGTAAQFDKIVVNTRKLCSQVKECKAFLKINVSFIITMRNYKQISKMMKFAIDLGVGGVHFQNVMDFNTEFAQENRPIFDSDKEAVSFIRFVKKPAGLQRLILPSIFCTDLSYFTGPQCCSAPFHSVGINTNGDINTCCYVNTHKKYGNIFTEYDFWNNSIYQKVRRELLNGTIPFSLCKTCPAYGIRIGTRE